MWLPNADQAVVEERKITEYLMSESHPDGASKAMFFSGFGFKIARWQELAESLRLLARVSPVSEVRETPYGRRFVVRGRLDTPSGRRPTVRTVWVLEPGAPAPRLVTAFPD
jgi:hypothetical protein